MQFIFYFINFVSFAINKINLFCQNYLLTNINKNETNVLQNRWEQNIVKKVAKIRTSEIKLFCMKDYFLTIVLNYFRSNAKSK